MPQEQPPATRCSGHGPDRVPDTIEGEPETVLRPGDVFYEPEGARITRFDGQDAGVTFLACFLLGPDQEPEASFPAG